MNVKKLEKIFRHYKKRHKLKTTIDIDSQGQACNYNQAGDYIFIGGQYIKRLLPEAKVRSGQKSLQIFYIFSLLHEIKHAIDNKYHRKILEAENQHLNKGKYLDSRKYHNQQPFEIRADNFAKKELGRWLK